jgi:ribose 5-phosphate isomerase A
VKIAEKALEYIKDGDVVGLGTGRAAADFVRALGERVRAGLKIKGIPTSQKTRDLAQGLDIPLAALEQAVAIDVTVDGADEVDPHLNLIKGWGGALVREKIVAAASRRLVILVGLEKVVRVLGSRGSLPVEVIPFGLEFCRDQLRRLGCDPVPRMEEGRPFQTDNGNHILDCRISPLDKPWEWERAARAIPGVVGTGLFLGMAHIVLVQNGAKIKVLKRENS